jgi:tRNA threonylcarbamoyladenosine biosynthesis protein TsaE
MANDTSLNLNLPTLKHTLDLGKQLGRLLSAGTILLLEGDLGAGKTTLIQGLGAGLGITDAIVSPTFALIHEYPEGRIPLYHFDLYRLTSAEVHDLHPEHYWLGLEAPLGITAIEWPQRLSDEPENYLSIELAHIEHGRTAALSISGVVDCWNEVRRSLTAESTAT